MINGGFENFYINTKHFIFTFKTKLELKLKCNSNGQNIIVLLTFYFSKLLTLQVLVQITIKSVGDIFLQYCTIFIEYPRNETHTRNKVAFKLNLNVNFYNF